tara:strand:- start:2619 stop:3194 length:576 start_codon:yes stop_codon:yes gene_type:complete
MRILFIVFLFLQSVFLFSQNKVEKETEIPANMFPKQAVAYVLDLLPEGKVFWIKEENESGLSYEAKFKLENKWYSIEFDEYGRLEDAEVSMAKKELEGSILKKIKSTLSKDFEKYKILKIQRQWRGNPETVKKLIQEKKESEGEGIEVYYEIVVQTFVNKAYSDYEYLFDFQGVFVRKIKFQQTSDDHLLY